MDSREKAQLGNYYLLTRDYEQAWKWYSEGAKERPPPPKDENPTQIWQRWLAAPPVWSQTIAISPGAVV